MNIIEFIPFFIMIPFYYGKFQLLGEQSNRNDLYSQEFNHRSSNSIQNECWRDSLDSWVTRSNDHLID